MLSRWRVRAASIALVAAILHAGCGRSPDAKPAEEAPPIITTAAGDRMVLVPAGSFRMGSGSGAADQQPVHEVWVDAFLIDRTEVTQAQYTRLQPVNGSHFKGPDRPVEMISWADAALWCNLRSKAEGLAPCYDDAGECDFEADGYRLPTEAEWEYACRAGTDGDYAFDGGASALAEHAWYKENAGKTTHPAGQKEPNAWGLYDMHGNVAEWCNDVYAKDYYRESPGNNPRGPKEGDRYVLRGGAWNSGPDGCAAAHRVGETPGFQDSCFARDAIGFRCVRKAPAEKGDESNLPRSGPEGASHKLDLSPFSAAIAPATLAAAGPPSPPVNKDPPMRKTGLVYGDVYLKHNTGAGHPERPERLTSIVARLKKDGLWEQLALIPPAPAAEEWITAVHSPEHLAKIKKACATAGEETYVDSGDTPVSRDSHDAALNAAGGVLAAVDAVMEGKVESAFCAVRPPGHHALRDRAMGFCLLNNVAIAARYLQKKHKLAKVLIVDWDVHHGNGTQAAFDEDPAVFYFSAHRHPFYPRTGTAAERGRGKAVGTKLNVPLPVGSADADYRRAFLDKLVPAAREFKPEFVLVSAGFDAHRDDPLGGMKVTAEGYAELTRTVRAIADEHCRGRLVAVLEGGYGLEGLAASVAAHLRVLMAQESR